MKFNCPACGAEVAFQSRISISATCTSCGSLLVRRDLDIENLGKQAMLPPDMTPLQVGTAGVFEKVRFQLMGRMRIAWQDGFWNEWYASFEDGREGWLAEAQGFYMMSFREITEDIVSQNQIRVGAKVGIGATRFFVVNDIKECWCIGSEGELPVVAIQGRKAVSVDLSDSAGHFASIEYSDSDTRTFVGRYVEFDEMAFSGLRDLDGW